MVLSRTDSWGIVVLSCLPCAVYYRLPVGSAKGLHDRLSQQPKACRMTRLLWGLVHPRHDTVGIPVWTRTRCSMWLWQ